MTYYTPSPTASHLPSLCTQNVQVDWVITEAMKVDLPELHCPILTHIVYSLLDQVDPPQVSKSAAI